MPYRPSQVNIKSDPEANLQVGADVISLRAALTGLQNEMDLARRIQSSLFPKEPPRLEGLDLWGVSRPASHVGGDFYDFIARPDLPFTFLVGDVSGKGMPAALLMSMARTVIRAEADYRPAPTPETVLLRSNARLYEDFTRAGMFATVFLGQYEPSRRELLFANAGQSPVIFCPTAGRSRLLEADGTALGVLLDNLSCNQCLHLAGGDVLVAATDGLNEARNPLGERFGYDRLLRHVEALACLPARDIAEGLFNAVQDFCAGEPQEDDQTVVVLRCMGR